MRIVCPTCNAAYNIASNKIPPGRVASTTCKKCGGKIVIESRAEKVESEDFEFDIDREQEGKVAETSFEEVSQPTPELKKASVILLIFLCVITFSIYYPVSNAPQ